jgi:hypothetical protein
MQGAVQVAKVIAEILLGGPGDPLQLLQVAAHDGEL